MSRLEDLPA